MQIEPEEQQRAGVERSVREAFGTEPLPSIYRSPRIGEVENMRAELTGVPWQKLSADQLMRHRAALSMLNPEAFAYYLPAFLLAGIEIHDIRDAVLNALAPQGGTKHLDATAPAVFAKLTSALTPPQKDAIRAWLRWARTQYVSPKRYASMSLKGPWLGDAD
jgi:hypothetical protein